MKTHTLFPIYIYLILCFLLLSTTSLAQVSIRPLNDAELAEQARQLFEQQQLELELRRSIGQVDTTQTSTQAVNQAVNQSINQTIPIPTNTQNHQVQPLQIAPIQAPVVQQPIQQAIQQAVPQATVVQPTAPNVTPNNLQTKSQQTAFIQSLKRSLVPSSWPPNLNSTWQVQLFLDGTTPINTTIQADIYDIEIDAPQEVIDLLKSRGHKVICYLNAGTAESFRPSTQIVFDGDLSSDTELLELWRRRGILGNVYGERFGNEFWMNPNHNFVRNYVQALLNKCKHKGFDGVSFDNLDGYSFDKWNPEPEQTGFNITEAEQLDYNLWLVAEAHKRGLYAGLKNTGEIAEPLSEVYDWVFVESCYSERIQGWDPACENYARYFATKGKAIYLNEYDWNMQNLAAANNMSLTELRKQYCSWAEEDGIFLMFRVDDTKASRTLCTEL